MEVLLTGHLFAVVAKVWFHDNDREPRRIRADRRAAVASVPNVQHNAAKNYFLNADENRRTAAAIGAPHKRPQGGVVASKRRGGEAEAPNGTAAEIGGSRRWLRKHVAADKRQGGGARPAAAPAAAGRSRRSAPRVDSHRETSLRTSCGEGWVWPVAANKAAGRPQPQNKRIRAKLKGVTKSKLVKRTYRVQSVPQKYHGKWFMTGEKRNGVDQ